MNTYETTGGRRTSIQADYDTPDRMASRKEDWHEGDEETDPELAPDNDGETIDAAGIKGIPRDALKTLLRFIIPTTSVSNAKKYRSAQLRLIILGKLVGVDDLAEKTLDSMAKDLGFTRSLLSLYQTRMADSLRFEKTLTGKTRQARESYKKSATAYHRRAGHRMASDGPLADSASK